jgi:acyl carrier protein
MQLKKSLAVEETLSQIIAKVLHRDKVTLKDTTTFKELGADSLQVVQILVAIEDVLKVDLVDKELRDIGNMGEFIRYLKLKIVENNRA